jgi:hypothetical protein
MDIFNSQFAPYITNHTESLAHAVLFKCAEIDSNQSIVTLNSNRQNNRLTFNLKRRRHTIELPQTHTNR